MADGASTRELMTSSIFTTPEAYTNTTGPPGGGHQNQTADIFRQVSFAVIGSASFLGNLAVVMVMIRSRAMMVAWANRFLLNQSVIDMTTGAILLVTAFTTSSGRYPQRMRAGLAGVLQCKLWESTYFLWATAMTSTYNLLAITLERYLAIVHPIWYRTRFHGCLVGALLVQCWVVGLTFNLFTPVLTHVVDGRCRHLQWESRLQSRAVGVFRFLIQFLLPLAAMVGTYIRILAVLRRMGLQCCVMRTLITVCVSFVLCWVWNQTVFMLYTLDIRMGSDSAFYNFSVTAAHVNSAINPVLYTTRYPDFRHAAITWVFPERSRPHRRSQVGVMGVSEGTTHTQV